MVRKAAMPTPDLQARLSDFVSFAQSLKGDEKGEAPLFLDRLFEAFGHEGTNEAGATHEFRVSKKGGVKGKNFADLLWPQRVLFEMKSRKEKLERHYDQLFDYWTHIVPHRPPYAVLCNFDEFWIYDFNTQLFDPVDKIKLADLPQRWAALAFLLPHAQKPLFENNRVAVTQKAAAQLAQLFRALVKRGEDRVRAQRFVLQILVSLVSEDLGLLPDFILTRLIEECEKNDASAFDLLGGLFRQMNTKEEARGGRYQRVQYFNGGLFAHIDPVDLKKAELQMLATASEGDWSKVKPEIFGALFQSSMDDGVESGRDERHAFGAHFTSEFDIQKVVGPTIVRPWRARIAAAWKNMDQLMKVLTELRAFRVLDPACGSGNFLAVAYREMKRMEQEILNRLRELTTHTKVRGSKAAKSVPPEALMNAVSIQQFFGIDVLPFAAELAKVTLMVAKEMWIIDNHHEDDAESLFARETPLPLDNLDDNILCADALFTEWPKADAIIGNPPYLGSRYIAQEHGYKYANKLYDRFPNVPKMADFCTHWFRLAHDTLPEGGRAGLVGTNTIRQNEGREASLNYIVEHGGTITEAVSTQVWSGDAAVHVSIVNWLKGEEEGAKKLYTQVGDSEDDPWKMEEVGLITASLSTGLDLSGAEALVTNEKAKKCFTGQNPVNAGFFLEPAQAQAMIAADSKNRQVLFPYMIGRDLVEAGGPTRWIIDFAKRDTFGARSYPIPFEHIKQTVMPSVVERAEKEQRDTGKEVTRYTRILERWWQFYDYRPGTIAAINSVPRYIAVSRVTKRPIFEFVSKAIHADTALVIFPLADDYSFGILQSGIHFEWFKARCSTLESRFRYTSDTVFDSFPWPQSPTRIEIEAVARAAVELRRLRHHIMKEMGYSLRDLYRTLEEPGANPLRDAQAKLDTAVRTAYGMPKDEDILQFLLDLNLECAAREKAGEKINPPGLPLSASDRDEFITEDCIRVADGSDPNDSSTAHSYAEAAHYHDLVLHEDPPKKPGK